MGYPEQAPEPTTQTVPTTVAPATQITEKELNSLGHARAFDKWARESLLNCENVAKNLADQAAQHLGAALTLREAIRRNEDTIKRLEAEYVQYAQSGRGAGQTEPA